MYSQRSVRSWSAGSAVSPARGGLQKVSEAVKALLWNALVFGIPLAAFVGFVVWRLWPRSGRK